MDELRGPEQPAAGGRAGRVRVRSALAAGLAGGAVALLALALVPAATYEVGPARISAKAHVGSGATSLSLPPLGSVRAPTHVPPLSVNLSLAELDVARLAEEVDTDADRRELTRDLASDLRAMAGRLALRLLLFGVVFGGVGLALMPRRRWAYIGAGAVGGAVAVGALVGATAASFDAERFQEPRFTGALTRAPVVIDAIARGEISIPHVRSRYEGAAERLSSMMALLAEPDQDPRHESVAILHISDVHSNPIGIELARQLARRFEVDAILDTGDLTNFGVHLETRIADIVEALRVPYYFVPGNHDAAAVRGRLEAADNVTVIDRETELIAGIPVLGWGDPTYTNWNALPPEEAAEVRRDEASAVAAAVRTEAPAVLAVHDHRLAGESIGLVPLVLSGHYHRQIFEVQRGTRILGVGTTGASGFKSFTLEARMDYEAQIVYFRGSRAVALDYVTVTGLGGDFQVQRRLLEPLELEGAPEEGEELDVPAGEEEEFEPEDEEEEGEAEEPAPQPLTSPPQ